MAFHRGNSACKALSSCSATVVLVTYAANNQLRNTVIIGPKPSISYSLPDEGVYILYRNRAIQVSGAPCNHRQCNSCQICCCGTGHFTSSIFKQPVAELSWNKGPCHDCLVNWLHLYEATEISYMNGMNLFAVPRTLTWASPFGCQAFHYDIDLEGNCDLLNYNFPASSRTSKSCPPTLLDSMVQGCKVFLSRGSYKPNRSIISMTDSDDDSGYDSASDSDWDDFDTQLEDIDSESSEEDHEEDFDLINDIIEEEFPKLTKIFVNSSTRYPKDQGYASTTSDGEVSQDAFVPAIIPPKNMAVGELFADRLHWQT